VNAPGTGPQSPATGNTATGQLVELDRAAAERRAERIRLRLDAIADNYAAVMPLIREAIESRDDLALGYASVSAYVADRFGGALSKLGVDMRREVVRELTEAGMSTRSIAPVLGVGKSTVERDVQQVSHVGHLLKTPASAAGQTGADAGQTPQGGAVTPPVMASGDKGAPEPPATRPAVTGIDGKTYPRPEPERTPRSSPRPTAEAAVKALARATADVLQVLRGESAGAAGRWRDVVRQAWADLAGVLELLDEADAEPDAQLVAAASDIAVRADVGQAVALSIARRVRDRHDPADLPRYVHRIDAATLLERYRPPKPKASPADPCAHGVAGGRRVIGRGKAASRVCDRCEAEDPAIQEATGS
jgi:hypothetical protein